MNEIVRTSHEQHITRLLRENQVVALLGARQVGKTTLAKALMRGWDGEAVRFDLEDPRDLGQLDEPMLALEPLRGLVVIDEVQRRPELFPTLRVLADRSPSPAKFLVLGSASPELLRQGSESLAGRIAFHELSGFDLEETGPQHWRHLWLRGGFPRAYLPVAHRQSMEWRKNFTRTFLERDLPAFGSRVPARTMSDFWSMLAHYHGQIWNGSEIGRAFGVSHTAVRRYLDLLSSTFMVRQLRPWTRNPGKRIVKSPKVYIADSGLLHNLLGVATPQELAAHPKVGASFEGFALEQVLRRLEIPPDDAWYWATPGGAELDLLLLRGSRRFGFEFKRTDAPKRTRSMLAALEALQLERIDVIYPGTRAYRMHDQIRAVPLASLTDELAGL
ncbi:MAG: ATP-binding protein [Gammaproteobacteria bacterium]|nr:ATP-binding protein [Gammaproteobacteria bacterium]